MVLQMRKAIGKAPKAKRQKQSAKSKAPPLKGVDVSMT